MTFHTALKLARQSSHLSLRQLATICGISSSRLTRLERGLLHPTGDEREVLARCLSTHMFELRCAPVQPRRLRQKWRSRGLRHLQAQQLFHPPRDRVSRVRLHAARRTYPEQMRRMTRLLKKRPDFEELNSFCETVSLGSGLECLFLTALLLRGAEPATLSPSLVPPRLPHDVVCPRTRESVFFRPHPCLLTQRAIYIPQVTFATPRFYTVDFLRNCGEAWSVIEIDGAGHDFRGDRARTRTLGIPVERLSEVAVLKVVGDILG